MIHAIVLHNLIKSKIGDSDKILAPAWAICGVMYVVSTTFLSPGSFLNKILRL